MAILSSTTTPSLCIGATNQQQQQQQQQPQQIQPGTVQHHPTQQQQQDAAVQHQQQQQQQQQQITAWLQSQQQQQPVYHQLQNAQNYQLNPQPMADEIFIYEDIDAHPATSAASGGDGAPGPSSASASATRRTTQRNTTRRGGRGQSRGRTTTGADEPTTSNVEYEPPPTPLFELGEGYPLDVIQSHLPRLEVDSELRGDKCAICQGVFVQASMNCTVTPCDHWLHFECAKQWFRRRKRCPICRRFIVKSTTHLTAVRL
ncbi:hypothetical protein niasHT_004936 [Heterodera trifolii]|uniref:RING-type domain-containing protein n=1 Tax=Heterodera trifolii TaxID=157864 RepID=A0ABD2M8J7_9BILA